MDVMKRIRIRVSGFTFHTPKKCKYFPDTNIGSMTCAECEYNRGHAILSKCRIKIKCIADEGLYFKTA
jgi:hypothetical protein